MKFATFFYPGYYQCSKRALAAGAQIDEWALLRQSPRSVFVETKEIVPRLGYTDSSDPAVMATEVELAYTHGVDAFIFNYYFDGKATELEKPLEVFVGLDTPLSFAINVCCHMPKRKLPFGVNDANAAPYVYLDERQFKYFAELLCNQYFKKANYLQSNDQAVVTFYHVNALKYLYGPDGLSRRLDIFRSVLTRNGIRAKFIGLFSVMGGWKRQLHDSESLPFDAYSCYVALPDFESNVPVQSFPLLARKWLAVMAERRATLSKPIVPCIGSGWNATARGTPDYLPNMHGLQFPYYPVVIDDDPVAFEAYLHEAVALVDLTKDDAADLLFLGPWNEWSEGCYLLPDRRFGFGKLQSIRHVKEKMSESQPCTL